MNEHRQELTEGGQVEIRDYGDGVVIDVTFARERDGLVVTAMELRGNELQITLEERY